MLLFYNKLNLGVCRQVSCSDFPGRSFTYRSETAITILRPRLFPRFSLIGVSCLAGVVPELRLFELW